MSDWKYAGIAALALLGAAAFIVFVIQPGGFEGQIGWFIVLLPGVLVGGPIADLLDKIAPLLSFLSYWGFILAASLFWYFAISYAAIKIYRIASSFFN